MRAQRLIVAKPIGRVKLLLYKYVGGLTFVFLLSVIVTGRVAYPPQATIT